MVDSQIKIFTQGFLSSFRGTYPYMYIHAKITMTEGKTITRKARN